MFASSVSLMKLIMKNFPHRWPNYLFLLLVYHTYQASSKFCTENCGKGKEKPAAKKVGGFRSLGFNDASTTRIVNGYDAPDRPWMVYIKMKAEDEEDDMSCGGAIINNRYVLTAGHCVCIDDPYHPMSELMNCDGGVINYDPKNVLRLYIGVNKIKLSKIFGSQEALQEHEYIVEKVIKHPTWDGRITPPDLSLLKTANKIIFRDGYVMPICVPKPGIDVHKSKGYVAGWGRIMNDFCYTNNFGPARHQRCRTGYIWKGESFSECNHQPPPTMENPKCQQFIEAHGINAFPKTGESIMLIYTVKKKTKDSEKKVKAQKKTICYGQPTKSHGWCGICLKSAKSKSDRGYCPPMHDAEYSDESNTLVKYSSNWGYCQDTCSVSQMSPDQLQETTQTILPIEDCTAFNNSRLNYRKEIEFCAGFQMQYPQLKVYKRYKRKKTNGQRNLSKYQFIVQTTKKNTLGIDHKFVKMGYYIGQTDSCQGDSGGPFYSFQKHRGETRATLFGVVSRGEECAGMNKPGIYTNIANPQWNKWLDKNTDDGGCD